MTVWATDHRRRFRRPIAALPGLLNHTTARLASERIHFESVRTLLLAQRALASNERLVCVLVHIVGQGRIILHSNNFAGSKCVLVTVVIIVGVNLEWRDVVGVIRILVQGFSWFHGRICDFDIIIGIVSIGIIIFVFIASVGLIIRRVSWFMTIRSTNDWFR